MKHPSNFVTMTFLEMADACVQGFGVGQWKAVNCRLQARVARFQSGGQAPPVFLLTSQVSWRHDEMQLVLIMEFCLRI